MALQASDRLRSAGLRVHALWTVTALLVAFGAFFFGLSRGTPADSPAKLTVRFTVPPPDGADFAARNHKDDPVFAVSPDGRFLAFLAATPGQSATLWIRSLDTGAWKALPATNNAESMFWSPDSRQIAFFSAGRLRRTAVDNGATVDVPSPGDGIAGTWGQHDTLLITTAAHGLLRMSIAGGEAAAVKPADAKTPRFLPDGRSFVFRKPDGLYVGNLEGDNRRVVSGESLSNVEYANGFLLFVRDRTLNAVPFDPRSGTASGSELTVARHGSGGTSGISAFSVSQNGVLVYRSEPTGSNPEAPEPSGSEQLNVILNWPNLVGR